MRIHSTRTSRLGLLILVLIFVILVALIVVFSQQILVGLGNIDIQASVLALSVAILLPLSLLGVIVYQIIRLIRERAAHKPGSRLKTKLLFFFVVVALLSTLPQGFVSVSFINSAIGFWLQARIEDALRGGLEVSLEYYQGMVENLDRFNTSSFLPTLLRDAERNPERMWRNLQNTNAQIDFIQVFEGEREITFQGDLSGRISDSAAFRRLSADGTSGNLPKEDREGISILRNIATVTVFRTAYTVIVGEVLAEGFDAKTRQLTESLETFNQLNRYRRLFRIVLIVFYFFFSFPIFLLSILIAFLLSEEIIRPIVNLEEATRRVADGDFSFRILTRSEDELSVLVSSFNRMVSELSQSRKKLVQAEKINAWQDIAQRLAHEIKNPLTPIKLSAQRILKRYRQEGLSEKNGGESTFNQILEPAVSAIIEEVDNLNQLLQEFREFARLPGPNLETVVLNTLVQEVADMYQTLSNAITIDYSQIDDQLSLRADRKQMKQVFANLFKNAMMAMPGGGEILISASKVQKEGNLFCRIWIKDNGEGIDEEIREFIFNPYFTTKKNGVGLGLSIVERVIFDHDGSIWFETQESVGTTFIIDLPLPAHR